MNLTNDQLEAIRTTGMNLCVDAGAGSGKTRVLVERVLHIVENRLADLDRIVAITFTENAAAEMKERLRRECRKRAPQDDPEQMSFWRDVERRVESARISTIHGFCARLLRENALQLGLDPDFVVMPEAESHLLRTDAVATALHDFFEEEDPAAIRVASEYGLKKVRDTLRKLLNTPALLKDIGARFPMDNPEALRREWERLAAEYRQRQLLELVHSRQLRRFRDALARFDGVCTVGDADSREAQRRHILVHLDLILANADAGTVEKCLLAIAGAEAGRGRSSNWSPEEAFKELTDLIKKVKDFVGKLLPPEPDPMREQQAAELACDFYRVYRRVAEKYDEAKGDGTALDFEDLIYRALHMLRDNPDIRARTARGIRFLLVDEFQDTDAVQFEIATLLTGEPDGPELFIVGDVKQSIYYFRGAEVDVFRQARGASGRTIPLARNYRSVPEVLQFVNDLFAGSDLLRAVEIAYRGMDAHRDACGECRVEFLLPEAPEEKAAKAEQRGLEADLIAARLSEMCGSAPVTVCDKETGLPRPATFGDAAILFRSLTDVYVYEERLKRWGIPYTLAAGSGFYRRQEIVDLRNLLTLVVDPWDEMALLAYLRSPVVGLSDEAILRFRGWGDGRRGLADAFNRGDTPEDENDADLLRNARRIVADLRTHRELPLPELLRRALDLTGYEAVLLDQFLGTQKASNVRKLLDLAHDFSRTRPPRLAAFLRYLDDVATQDIREGDAALAAEGVGAVTLTTIHKAKGLEFPITVIPDLARSPQLRGGDPVIVDRELGIAACAPDDDGEDQKSALYLAIADLQRQRELAEEARVLYVAMTRARDWLLLSSAPMEKRVANSWLETFQDRYDLLARRHGEEFRGNGWRAVVRRRVDGAALAKSASPEPPLPPREAVEARVAPVAPGPTARRIFSVTEVLNRMPAADAEHPSGEGNANRTRLIDPAARGTMLHMLFQHWDLRAPVRPVAEALCRKECPSIGVRGRVAEDLVAVAERFRETELAARIAAQRNLQREVPFVLRIGETLIAGAVDAVLDDGTVVDYKTGERSVAAQERYERQVLLYALAHAELQGTTPPEAFLAYVDTSEVVRVAVTPERLAEVRRLAADAVAAIREVAVA